jgi:hypothetical protein
MTVSKGFVLIALVVLVAVSNEVEAAVNAATCSRADVGTAVQLALEGDTVMIPAGVCTWTSTLTIQKAITLQGAGIDKTTIQDGVPRSAGGSLVTLNTTTGKFYRVSGFTFARGPVTDMNWNGAIVVGGTSKTWRIDGMKFQRLAAKAIVIYGDTYGVVDHSVFDQDFTNGVSVNHDNWNGKSYGDGSWADAPYLGTEKAVYVEDCTFTSTAHGAVNDVGSGGRMVFRYNTVTNDYLQVHGTDSSQRRRSARSFEIYNNTFTDNASWFTALYLRGGTGVIFNNTFRGYGSAINLLNFRSNQAYTPWGMCDGLGLWDGNQQGGYPCLDQIGRGAGNLISGDAPGPLAWPQQASEPLYQWNNTFNGGPVNASSQNSSIQVSRDYFNNVAKPGYAPYTYPHPLTNGGLPTPTNLQVR